MSVGHKYEHPVAIHKRNSTKRTHFLTSIFGAMKKKNFSNNHMKNVQFTCCRVSKIVRYTDKKMLSKIQWRDRKKKMGRRTKEENGKNCKVKSAGILNIGLPST